MSTSEFTQYRNFRGFKRSDSGLGLANDAPTDTAAVWSPSKGSTVDICNYLILFVYTILYASLCVFCIVLSLNMLMLFCMHMYFMN